ncbi:MAG: flavodoxin domain-containing protein [Bacteroidales bacterium]|nr:flavodoxin domain-containing protein [Bacteroidales bacterium]HOK98056.1 flavodoxin domain-containing protein [Bacteroidales bacterium]HPO64469.1 flavodoxin domain-containing protein [Bacteroidales bacterium]
MNKRDFFKTGLVAVGTLLLPRKAWALEYYPTVENTEWAILYSTWCGTSRDASVWISEGMNGIADVYDVRENPDLSRYKHVIVGGSIRSGVTSQKLQDYLITHRDELKNKIRAYFAVCGNMRQPVSQEQYHKFIDNHLVKLTGVGGLPAKVFLGRITWGLLEPDVREMLKSFPNMEEYDNLKRSECMAFGQDILKTVNP